jgi:hypothetical protein
MAPPYSTDWLLNKLAITDQAFGDCRCCQNSVKIRPREISRKSQACPGGAMIEYYQPATRSSARRAGACCPAFACHGPGG